MKTTTCRTNASEAIASSLGFQVSGFRGFPFKRFGSVDPHLMGRFSIKTREGEARVWEAGPRPPDALRCYGAWL